MNALVLALRVKKKYHDVLLSAGRGEKRGPLGGREYGKEEFSRGASSHLCSSLILASLVRGLLALLWGTQLWGA